MTTYTVYTDGTYNDSSNYSVYGYLIRTKQRFVVLQMHEQERGSSTIAEALAIISAFEYLLSYPKIREGDNIALRGDNLALITYINGDCDWDSVPTSSSFVKTKLDNTVEEIKKQYNLKCTHIASHVGPLRNGNVVVDCMVNARGRVIRMEKG